MPCLCGNAYSLCSSGKMSLDQGDFSPLKHFVLAKKRISDIFEQLLSYVQETSEFVEGEWESAEV